MLTKKDYEELARNLSKVCDDCLGPILELVVAWLKHDNPRFDATRFKDAISKKRQI